MPPADIAAFAPTRRGLLRSAGAAAALAGAPGLASAQSRLLVISDFGGEWADWNRREMDSLFNRRTSFTVNRDAQADNAARIAKIELGMGQGTYDIGCFADVFFARAEAGGLLGTLNKASPRLTNLADTDPRFVTANYAAHLYNALGMAYNPRLVRTPPTGWADMWKPEYRGKIVLPAVGHSFGLHVVLLCALAAGKPITDLDAAFEKLKALADLRPIWSMDSQAVMRSLRDEEAVIGWIGRGEHSQIAKGGGDIRFLMPSEGGFSTCWAFAPIRTTRNIEQVEEYINISLDPRLQAKYATFWGFNPTNKHWKQYADAETISRVSLTPEEVSRFVPIDYKWLSERRAEMTDRWNRIVGA